jgi:acetyl esterase/lipase
MRTGLVLILAAALAGCAAAPTTSRPMRSQVPAQIASQLRQIGPVVAPPPTAAIYAPMQQREPYAGVKVTRDLHYGPDARHLLDVFTPESGGGARPVLVFVHGGGFIAGNKRTGDSPFYDNVMLWAVKNGMVGVNMTYRLAPQHPWPAAQQDIGAALSWVRREIAARGGDPQRVILMGHSAGATHVAEYVAHPEFHAGPRGGIAGAVMVSGVFDTTTAEINPPLQAYFGKDASLYAQRSALPGMLKSGLPMLLAYAELDPRDFQRQGEQVHAALCQAGNCPPLLKLTDHSHMSEVYSINTSDTSLTDALRAFVMRR